MDSWLFWLLLTFVCIVTEGAYSSLEMAMVSFDPIRLQGILRANDRRAHWIKVLREKPFRLFGTTLLGVNLAMQIGSECSRRLYAAWDVNPNFAPLTQIILVLLFAELAPIFAARRHPVQLSLFGAGFLYFSSKFFAPAIWALHWLVRGVSYLFGAKEPEPATILSREEAHLLLKSSDQEIGSGVLALHEATVQDISAPLSRVPTLPASCLVERVHGLKRTSRLGHLLLYEQFPNRITGVLRYSDLALASAQDPIKSFSHPPWLVHCDMPFLSLVTQFQSKKMEFAIVVNGMGKAVGFVSRAEVLQNLLGLSELTGQATRVVMVDRKISAKMNPRKLNQRYGHLFDVPEGVDTVEELMALYLGKKPELGDSVQIGQVSLRVTRSTLLGVKEIRLQTKS